MKWFLHHALAIVAAVLIGAGLIAGVVNREVLDADRFAAHVDQVRTDSDVSRHLGVMISDEVIEAVPNLIAIRPLLESSMTAVVASPALGGLVRNSLAPLHSALVSGDGGNVVLRLADISALAVAGLSNLDSKFVEVIPENLDVQLASVGSQEATRQLIEATHFVRLLSWLLPLLGGLALFAAAMLRKRTPLSFFSQATWVAWVVTGILAFFTMTGRMVFNRGGDGDLLPVVMAAGWRELETTFWDLTLLVGVLALILTLVARPGYRLNRETITVEIPRWLAGRSTSWRARAMRAFAFLGLAGLLVLEPITTLAFVLVAAGAVIGVFAVREVGIVVLEGVERHWPRLLLRFTQTAARGAAIAVAAVVLAGVVSVQAFPNAVKALPAVAGGLTTTGCNGHDELCDRPYNEIAYIATHNSMSAATEPGWFLAEQPKGVIGQLNDGVRVFLIDSWMGQSTNQPGIVATAAGAREAALAQAEADYGASVVESALRIRDSFDLTPTGSPEPYLCHGLCELGSTRWTPLMGQVRAWMAANPREVVTFFIQDEVTPARTAQVFAESGLSQLVYTPTWGQPWPTLEEMIDSGRRVVVLHENAVDRSVPWILDGEVWSQDTPYDFSRPSEFSCERYRGQAEAPLFLVNHWLNDFARRVADAARVNTTEVLGQRLAKCQEERGQIPNFVAVNYYDKGDVEAVVDALNGLK